MLFEVASAQGNVGLLTGITGPASLPAIGKGMFRFNMWIGRLETIPVLVTIRAGFEARGGVPMTPRLSLLSRLQAVGPQDNLFDGLLLAGPVL